MEVESAPDLDRLSAAFEHSITWEDDIWRADPVDVEIVHAHARRKFNELLDTVTAVQGGQGQARILLFHGQSGAGKTHLIRALRTSAHRSGKAYVGYAQMTPDVANYADYYLRRLVNSLEKPYDPDTGGETALQRLTRRLTEAAEPLDTTALDKLRDAKLSDAQLAKLVLALADQIVAAPKFASQPLDINIVRALLYLQRADPRIDQRVRQYLYGRELTDLSAEAVAVLDPNRGEGRAFEIIESLGRLMWIVDGAALVISIDQVEDLRFFDDYHERFQKAARDLIQIANRVPTSIVLLSCLGDFYGKVREVLAQSYVDRIEKAGPVSLKEARTAEEAQLIIAKRMQADASRSDIDPLLFFGPQFFEEFSGLSTRRILELAQARVREQVAGTGPSLEEAKGGFISTLAAALGFGGRDEADGADASALVEFHEHWDRFTAQSEAEIPSDDHELLTVLTNALSLARAEWGGALDVVVKRLELGPDLPVLDLSLKHEGGNTTEARVFLCNRPTQGGGLKRQLDKLLAAMGGRSAFLLRASDFPPNKKNQTGQAFRKFRELGGRSILVPIPDWERMMMVCEFHAQHRRSPGFAHWFERAKLLSEILSLAQLLRLELFGRALNGKGTGQSEAQSEAGAEVVGAMGYASSAADWTGWGPTTAGASLPAGKDADLPLSVLLDETGDAAASILAGRALNSSKSITLNRNVLKRHAAVLGGSGSGKTTLALCIIEQLLLRGTPVVLIDRKGDLCSYANPDVWRAHDGEFSERRGEREKLADSIDVAVYTPGRASGRPISITLLPNGINELPDQEQQLLANMSAAALGDMLHFKNSATHQKQSGTLSVALRILGSRFSKEVTLADLIYLLEDEDPELTDLTQRMDPSGRIRRDLVAQLDSLRHRNAALFEAGGEPLRMDSLLGMGRYGRTDGRTRLSIIYTGFLGDNENILFWVSQFLSEALRFCQRNPNDELQAVVMFDEADLYIPANAKPATAEPLQSLLKRARSAGLGIMLATQSPGDLDYKSRDQITSWFIGRVREDTALRKLRAAFQSESGLDPGAVLPGQTVGEFHLVQEGLVRPMRAQKSLIVAEQVPFDRIEQLARETKGQDEKQLKLFA
ncbi:MAG TPA: helicase HerA-like domain-containing protein [Hyphomicrobiaceae bacterium]|nr:helicase HerA-like domain-containing protein [Hyphomicrobiaceae bacterium]